MFHKKILLSFAVLLLLFSSAAYTTEGTFPYINATIRIPGLDSPFPGLGNGHSALSSGIRTAMWNPAGLAKIKVSEAYFGITTTPPLSNADKMYKVNDSSFEVNSSSSSETGFSNMILFTGDPNGTFTTTREFNASILYAPSSSGMDYKQSIKVGDNLAFGIISRGETSASLDIMGSFPAQYFSKIDLYNTKNFLGSGISVGSDGRLTYAYNPGGSNYVYTSEASVWTGFLKQNQRIPFSVVTDSNNDLNVEPTLTFSGAGVWNKIYAGINITPISGTLNVDNTAKAIVNEGTADPYFYAPNFDPNSETDVLQWMTDPNRYSTEYGYKKQYIRVPAGESIAEAKYTGFYTASAMKIDLGAMYDVGEVLTFGLVFENFNDASLNFKGTGRVAYVDTRINTAEVGQGSNPLDPSSTTVWSPFSDTFSPMDGTENIGMMQNINFSIPKRTKLGVALKKPFLITLDYEIQNTPWKYRYTKEEVDYDAVISNIKILRGAGETQFLFLPLILRGNLALLLKPDISGADPDFAKTFNDAFLMDSFLPISFGLGLGANLWGYKTDASLGFDASSVISVLQADTLNSNLGKVLYYSLSVTKDNWYTTLENVLDPASTAAAVQAAPESERKSFNMNLIKWISTLTVGFKF